MEQDDNNTHKPSANKGEKCTRMFISMAWLQPENWVVADHFETWYSLASAGQFDGQGGHHTPKPYVRQAFRKYLECGIFAPGFARGWCDDCGHDYFVAYSCKGRGVCRYCTTGRMVETAAHLTDHAFPRLPVRQCVLLAPKRLR